MEHSKPEKKKSSDHKTKCKAVQCIFEGSIEVGKAKKGFKNFKRVIFSLNQGETP